VDVSIDHSLPDDFRSSDDLWALFSLVIPPDPPSGRRGRPKVEARRCFDAIFYILRTGAQWRAIPRDVCAHSTAHDRFQEWQRNGVFALFWVLCVGIYDQLVGIDWVWQAVDCCMTKAPLGGESVGHNPTDRSKIGTKRSILTDGRGVALGLAVDGANRHDSKLLGRTLDLSPIQRPVPKEIQSHLCLDKAYDGGPSEKIVEDRGYIAHIKSRGDEETEKKTIPGYRARRWVVERTHSWMNRFRRLLIRWEKKVDNYIAFLHLASAFSARSMTKAAAL